LFVQDSPEAALEEIRNALGSATEPAGEALGVWRAAREQLALIESRLEARTRELGLLQSLGQKAAEERSHEGLFRVATEILQSAADLELILVLHRLDGPPRARCFLARPVDDGLLRDLARESARFLDWEIDATSIVRSERLGTFDESRWSLRSFKESDLVMLPIMRRGAPVACIALLHAGRPDEGRLRVLYSGANLLSLHMDRILTVQEAERDRFRFILDSMPQAVVLADGSLRILLANPSARKLLDGLEIPAGSGTLDRLGELSVTDLAARVASGRSGEASGEAHLDNGRILTVSVSAFVPEGPTRTSGFVVVISDVTESRRLQEQLAQAEKMSSLGQMISGVAHELNNPLASILGYAQLVRAGASDPDLAERLDVLHKEARRCQRIVSNLLSFARRHEPERQPLSLNQSVQAVTNLMAYQLRVDGIAVESDLDRELPAVMGDTHQLQQALLNLFTNAHHAMKDVDGQRRIRVGTRVIDAGDAVELMVEDSGPGIPKAVRSRIFDPFFTTKGPGEGTGLGLSLVYGTVAAHGGTIHAEEGTDAGARFVLRFPAGRSTGTDPGPEPASDRNPEPPAGDVLVVDDEETVAALMKDTLESWGHRVTLAADGAEALDRLDARGFDLVIMDFRMPVMDGRRLHEEILRRHPLMSSRVVLTTGDTVSGDPERFASRAGVPVLPKPFELEQLRRTVRERLTASRESRP
jgi:two-component system NtrC family sensor kinase